MAIATCIKIQKKNWETKEEELKENPEACSLLLNGLELVFQIFFNLVEEEGYAYVKGLGVIVELSSLATIKVIFSYFAVIFFYLALWAEFLFSYLMCEQS